jgi:hypothetical protein
LSSEQLKADDVEELMFGLVNSMSRRVSLNIPKEVRKSGGRMDRVAEILIQGRDHGLPSYVAWREFCGMSVVDNFTDLSDIISIPNIAILSTIYRFVIFSVFTCQKFQIRVPANFNQSGLANLFNQILQ